MKYIIVTFIYVCLVMLGWYFSLTALDSMIDAVFRPDGHDQYLDIWFALFASIEGVITVIYAVTLYRLYRVGKSG